MRFAQLLLSSQNICDSFVKDCCETWLRAGKHTGRKFLQNMAKDAKSRNLDAFLCCLFLRSGVRATPHAHADSCLFGRQHKERERVCV